jgi:N-acetylmuramoyl-L-alanine amidase
MAEPLRSDDIANLFEQDSASFAKPTFQEGDVSSFAEPSFQETEQVAPPPLQTYQKPPFLSPNFSQNDSPAPEPLKGVTPSLSRRNVQPGQPDDAVTKQNQQPMQDGGQIAGPGVGNQARPDISRPTLKANPSNPGKKGAVENGVQKGLEMAAQKGGMTPLGLAARAGAFALKNKEKLKKLSQAKKRLLVAGGTSVLILVLIVASLLSLGGIAQGDVPTAVAAGSIFGGKHCAEMQEFLDVPAESEGSHHLTLSSVKGKFSDEKVEEGPGLALYDEAKALPGFNQEWVDYYVNARWPYTGADFGVIGQDGSVKFSEEGFLQLPPKSAYAGKKIIIFNPSTGKAVVGVALDYGPAPWAGTSQIGSPDPDSLAQQEKWKEGSNNGYRIADPEGYSGRVVGGPPKVQEALGMAEEAANKWPDGIHVVYGFAKDQNLPVGPLNCTVVDEVSSSGLHICLDAGHDKENGGAVSSEQGTDETTIAWETTSLLKTELEKKGVTVTMAKTSRDGPVSNTERAKICNESGAQLAFHVHLNSANGSARGWEIYRPELQNENPIAEVREKSMAAVEAFVPEYKKSVGQDDIPARIPTIKNDGSTQHTSLAVSRTSTIPTMLIEMFFLDNRLDVAWYKNGGQSKLGVGMAEGLIAAGRAIGVGIESGPSGDGTFTPSGDWIWPLARNGKEIRMTNGWPKYARSNGKHTGIDINIGFGSGATVIAAHDGKVSRVKTLYDEKGKTTSFGHYVAIDAGDGIETFYAHMTLGSAKVTEGQIVKKGDPVGIVGCTGNCRGDHLHFEVQKNGRDVQPLDYLPPKP